VHEIAVLEPVEARRRAEEAAFHPAAEREMGAGGAVVGDPSDPALGELQGSGTVTINADGTATDVVKDADGKVISTRQVPLGQENVLPTE